jgi:hypothetical protein
MMKSESGECVLIQFFAQGIFHAQMTHQFYQRITCFL